MSEEVGVQKGAGWTVDEIFSWDMLRRVQQVDPAADAEAVRRFASELTAADAVLQSLALDPSNAPLDVGFSPEWADRRTP